VRLRGLDLAWGRRTYVMAILNVTPDSFSGDGLAGDPGRAMARARLAIAEGADLLDIGGESTRPGSAAVSADEEASRVVPLVRALREESDIPISVDTYKATVAAAALDAGADLVNDVWALGADPDMAALVAERAVPVVLMHNRSAPGAVRQDPGFGAHYAGLAYDDLVAEVAADLAAAVDRAKSAGLADAQIILDPGLGFGKTPAQNLEILDRLPALRELGFPLLVGPSRKSFVGQALGGLPPEERLEGTAAAVAVAIARGADLVRVHDVRAMVRVVRVADAIVRR
jgi:dihydropteroate synthase